MACVVGGSYALASVTGVVVVVQGVGARFFGWTLGPVEALNSVIAVGFSVDYVIHIAHRFTHCRGKDTAARVAEALATMGPTAIGGWVSTLAVTATMFMSQVRTGV